MHLSGELTSIWAPAKALAPLAYSGPCNVAAARSVTMGVMLATARPTLNLPLYCYEARSARVQHLRYHLSPKYHMFAPELPHRFQADQFFCYLHAPEWRGRPQCVVLHMRIEQLVRMHVMALDLSASFFAAMFV